MDKIFNILNFKGIVLYTLKELSKREIRLLNLKFDELSFFFCLL